jgi:hypothetical protein
MKPMNGKVYPLADPDFEVILQEKGAPAYVQALVDQYGAMITNSYDLRVFRHLRLAYAGAKNMEVDRLFVREMSKRLPLRLQDELRKELPKDYRADLDRWNKLPGWVRFILKRNRS